MQSAWHNLPTFDGIQQLPGAEYAAREVHTTENSITAELAGAYRLSQGLPPTAAVYRPVNRASPCGTKRTIPARWS